MTTFDAQTIHSRLAELASKDKARNVFGADGHHYQLNPPLATSVLDAFEKQHAVSPVPA